ncbi:MAG: efflux RND transporter periplasmic adaptor subunit [Pseudomonadales bacterium]|nr:efflux RND transporter periplasmic adaptor subunit [Pseudomonadales bacterium]
MNSRHPVLILCILVALLCACSRDEDSGAVNVPGTLITVVAVGSRDVPVVVSTMGRVEGRASPLVAAEVDARVLRLAVDEGDVLAADDVMAELDATTFTLALRAATAETVRAQVLLDNEERRVARLHDLLLKASIAREQYDDAAAQLAVLRAQRQVVEARLHLAEDQLGKTIVRAPIAGRVQARRVSVGDFVERGAPLFEIATSGTLRALLPFPEPLAAQLRPGQSVSLSSPIAPDSSARGVIAEMRPAVGALNRAVWAIVDIHNPGDWRPDSTVRAKITVAIHVNAVVIPERSLVRRPAGEVVYVIAEGRAAQRIVVVGERFDDMVEISSGLAVGEQIALEGAGYLSDGALVRSDGNVP